MYVLTQSDGKIIRNIDEEEIKTDIKYVVTFAELINCMWDIGFVHCFSLCTRQV